MTGDKVGKALNSAKGGPWRNSALWRKGHSVQGVPLEDTLKKYNGLICKNMLLYKIDMKSE
ncbi:MAG: hypothetical protein A2V96_01135 [Candidatus Yonathbacteria bacterium RBG_16_43_6]|uniref:Uncharacterized protein n=1 Tax=Candidatus Yonathbacteria bacterium RIFCSPLOWO2_01_FULL_43_27 TaxID=1802726 RepID=A0A1G2SCX6_9BACT|nr:MAG: hypothetical protein A2658_01605 [Candidatus Yonathbacteria bacterium RIFCSPHIGHO2_01_FULL_44_19]OHA79741.1 MAG: hypothetical protein A2V96_01135 [Candidatus Yonathbacteria bacterium RBG_16_43_6]OHA82648.1 MAG: hypothetical protein A3B07_01805 [Candidatus Yonathbacteria bacterium RIFCSPLOWO2_01_FULL_43_27]